MLNTNNFKAIVMVAWFSIFLNLRLHAQNPIQCFVDVQDSCIHLQMTFSEGKWFGGGLVTLESEVSLGTLQSATTLQEGGNIAVSRDAENERRWNLLLPDNLEEDRSLNLVLKFSQNGQAHLTDGGIVIVEVVEGYRVGNIQTIAIWPNPSQAQVFWTVASPFSAACIQKLDGEVLRQLPCTNVGSADLSGIEQGLLLFKAIGPDGETIFKRFMHQ